MTRRILFVAGLLATIGLMQSSASAQSDIVLPLDTVVQATPGDEVPLGQMPVESDLVGAECEWAVVAQNQESVHPGNDIILSTNGSDSVIAGVENEPNLVSTASHTVKLGETITVSLRMGSDGIFSGGLSVNVTCNETAVQGEVVSKEPAAPAEPSAPAPEPAAPTQPAAAQPAAAQPAAAEAQLALTGSSQTMGMVLLAGLLLVGGTGLLAQASRLEN